MFDLKSSKTSFPSYNCVLETIIMKTDIDSNNSSNSDDNGDDDNNYDNNTYIMNKQSNLCDVVTKSNSRGY